MAVIRRYVQGCEENSILDVDISAVLEENVHDLEPEQDGEVMLGLKEFRLVLVLELVLVLGLVLMLELVWHTATLRSALSQWDSSCSPHGALRWWRCAGPLERRSPPAGCRPPRAAEPSQALRCPAAQHNTLC